MKQRRPTFQLVLVTTYAAASAASAAAGVVWLSLMLGLGAAMAIVQIVRSTSRDEACLEADGRSYTRTAFLGVGSVLFALYVLFRWHIYNGPLSVAAVGLVAACLGMAATIQEFRSARRSHYRSSADSLREDK